MNTQLQKLFEDALKDIYGAGKHLTKALSKTHEATTTEELKVQLRNILPKQEMRLLKKSIKKLCTNMDRNM